MNKNPFNKAEFVKKRVKIFLWGDTGTGKTILSLHFPNPVVIDLQRGTEPYGDSFKFDFKKTTNIEEIIKLVEWLKNEPHKYQTLIIDPISLIWDAYVRKWSDIFFRTRQGTKAHKGEYYDLKPMDWRTVKDDYNHLMNEVMILDMNVIATAGAKTNYSDPVKMVASGQAPNCGGDVPTPFAVNLQLLPNSMAKVIKDTTHRLPKEQEFKCSYDDLAGYLGKDWIEQEADLKPSDLKQHLTINQLVKDLEISELALKKSLKKYGASDVENLTHQDAEEIINILKEKRGDK